MPYRILITGPPRCGKSTLILRIIKALYEVRIFNLKGFFTPEVREYNKRIGFDIEDIKSGTRFPFSRIGNFYSSYKIGNYHIFIDEFDDYLSSFEKIDSLASSIYIIDEIGKMELLSKKFSQLIKRFFSSNFHIIATIGQKLNHPVKDFINKTPDLHTFILNQSNQLDTLRSILNYFY